MVYVLTKLWRA